MQPELLPRIDELVDRLTLGAGKLERAPALPPRPEPLAFRRLLLAIDGSDGSLHATPWAREVARAFHGQVWPMTATVAPDVVEHYLDALAGLMVPGPSNLLQEEEQRALAVLEQARRDLGAVASEETVLRAGRAAVAVADAARDLEADLVVLGSHGHGAAGRLLLGSVADAVKNHVRASVLIAKDKPLPRRILAPVDGSRASKRAAGLALALGHAWSRPVTVYYVFEPLLYGPMEEIQRRYDQALEGIEPGWAKPQTNLDVGFGPPGPTILAAAKEGSYDLIVMGSRGLGGARSLVAGSVSNRVAHEAGASVLLVKEVVA